MNQPAKDSDPPIVYQIKDWNIHFENDKSRTRKQCSFVCVPNKQHGMGFCYIMSESDGAAIYGIWHCIVGACSQQKDREGWLTSNGKPPQSMVSGEDNMGITQGAGGEHTRSRWGADGEQVGVAWTVEDLSLKFRRPIAEIG